MRVSWLSEQARKFIVFDERGQAAPLIRCSLLAVIGIEFLHGKGILRIPPSAS